MSVITGCSVQNLLKKCKHFLCLVWLSLSCMRLATGIVFPGMNEVVVLNFINWNFMKKPSVSFFISLIH